MINTYKNKHEVWVDIDRGTPEEIYSIMHTYNVHPLVARELNSTTPKQRLEFHEGYIYCILHFPAYRHTHEPGNHSQEVDFIIGKHVLITARYDTIDALHEFGKNLEMREVLDHKNESFKHESLFVTMLQTLYKSLWEELEYIEDVTEDITAKIFTGKEKDMVVSISNVTRTLLDFKKIIDGHREILELLTKKGKDLFGKNFADEIELITLEYTKIHSMVRSNLETLRELRDTNNSLLTSKQNETVKQLTVVSFVLLPLNLTAFIFAMRTEGMPIIDNPLAFWIVIGIMITIGSLGFIYVKHKKWL
jgi:magnesium/cobalt transport protein CorA